MKALREALEEYLEVRRMFGFKLRAAGSLLHQFVSLVEREGASYVTRELAVQWATQPTNCEPCRWARRLGMVRSFARYVSATDPREPRDTAARPPSPPPTSQEPLSVLGQRDRPTSLRRRATSRHPRD